MIAVLCATENPGIEDLRLGIRLFSMSSPLAVADGKSVGLEVATLLIDGSHWKDVRPRFSELKSSFESWLKHDTVTVIVRNIDPFKLNPLADSPPEGIIAMLILAFPEVRWMFGTIQGYFPDDGRNTQRNKKLIDFRKAHGLHNLFTAQPNPLFDGSGLRDWIREQMIKGPETRKDTAHLPRRKQFAIGFDEESDYAHLHAYTSYRFGFRAAALTTKAEADCVVAAASKYEQPELVFEDLFLNLPDASGSYSWLGEKDWQYGPERKTCQRHTEFTRLETAEHRIVVTSGHRPSGDRWKKEATDAYIADKRANGIHIETVSKPHAGIFNIWEKTNLNKRLKWNHNGRTHRSTGKDFFWPPPWKELERESSGESSGHSAPGILLVIADSLIDRAEHLLDSVHSVEEAVRGAVLATDALELLGGKTPTISIEALCLKHKFEVMAECQFSGVEYHIDFKERLREIERECQAIAAWFHPRQAKAAAWNAEMHIVNQLVRILREYNQFDEEALCMHRVRTLHNRLWTRQKPPVIRTILFGLASYASWLMASFGNFVLSLAICVAGLGSLHVLLADHPEWDSLPEKGSVLRPIILGMEQVFPFFVGANEFPERWGISIIFALAALLGLIHLGIFLSFLYSVISRKS